MLERPPAPQPLHSDSVDSGKGAADENFPVGSWLIAPALRPAIAVFYRFARTADDIADSDRLSPGEKIARLQAMQAALLAADADTAAPGLAAAPSWVVRASALRSILDAHRLPVQHALDLLAAFKQDAVKSRYENWRELSAYCMLSAAPVGRFLLDLHGEDSAARDAADALCNALQVLNHLQDCGADYRSLDRVYLPLDWLREGGEAPQSLLAPRAGPAVRATIDRCLDATDRWIETAAALPAQLRSRRLAMESTVIVHVARRLSRKLRSGDPLAARVALTKPDFARAAIAGLLHGLRHRAPPTASPSALRS
jgi:squalene synthase HpnC